MENTDVKKDDLLDSFYAELSTGSSIKKEEEAIKKVDESVKKEPDEKDPLLDSFYSEIDNIKTEEFKSSSREQIERLLRPGSTYFNLNPFEVLQIDPYACLEEIKKKYRKLSIYVHPDKNPDDRERAQVAFEAVNRAYKLLEDEKERKLCLEVVDEAREKVDKELEEKRKKLRQQNTIYKLKHKLKFKNKQEENEYDKTKLKIDEDDPDKYRHAIYCMTCKLFADIERVKVRESEKQAQEKKRKAEEKVEEESKAKVQKEFDANYEVS
ncbi:unnamed protein product [Brachionus calyciflorus]|uniref:J domain-containing protein n=1 Tax=Brachionus calyciflorus TaxID=104777 RepID=A0A813YBY8_9BILA|nr:unnamed protein product [Brachionus calyciflorus]